MQWPCMTLQVKNRVVVLPLGGATWIKNWINVEWRCVQNKTMLNCTKNYANCFSRFEDMGSQT